MPALIVLAAALAGAWRVYATDAVPLLGNLLLFFHPLIRRATDDLQAGTAPLWNPYAFCGAPLAADPQAGVFTPSHLAFRFFEFGSAFKAHLLIELALLACFAYCLGRRLRLSPAGALLCALLASSNGFVFYHSGMIPHLGALIWMPAVLLFWISGAGVLAGLALGLQYLGGHPFFVFITLCACAFVRPARPLRTALRAVLVAAGVAAVQLLPTLELFAQSVRAGALGREEVFVFSVPPDALWTMLAKPLWNRDPAAFTADPSITAFYIGLPALAAAAWGAFGPRLAAVPLAWALGALALSLGEATPLYPLLLKLLPGLGLFRYPAQWLSLAGLALALLAGRGVDRLKGQGSRLALAAVIVADLWAFGGQAPYFFVDGSFFPARPAVLSTWEADSDLRVAHTRRFFAAQGSIPEEPQGGVDDWDARWLALKEALAPSHASAFRVREAVSDNIHQPARLRDLLAPPIDAAQDSPLLRFAGIAAVGDYAGGPALKRLPPPRERLSWVPRARRLDYAEALAHLRSPVFDPASEVIVENSAFAGGGGRGAITARAETPTRLRAEVRADSEGLLVWADTHYPGWSAYVNGGNSELLRANAAFRAVAVPSGVSDVRFVYRPGSFLLGLGVTLALLAALLAYASIWASSASFSPTAAATAAHVTRPS